MYGGIGGLIDGNITSKQEEINKLEAAKNLDGSKVNPGLDVVGEIATSVLPYIDEDSWLIRKRNEVSPIWLGAGDTVALATGLNLGAGTVSAIGAGANNMFRGNGPKISKRQAFGKGISTGIGKRTAWAAGIGGGLAILKALTAGGIEQ